MHLKGFSNCSKLEMSVLKREVKRADAKAVCITDHETIKGAAALKRNCDFLVITGVEVKTEFGDFLVYSKNYEYLKKLTFDDNDELIVVAHKFDELIRNDDNYIIWAHPNVDLDDKYFGDIASGVDAIELYNGGFVYEIFNGYRNKNYLEKVYQIARKYDKICVAASDTHWAERFMCCWVEIPEIKNQNEFIDVMKSKNVKIGLCDDLKWLKIQE